jgi:hypothetical protein
LQASVGKKTDFLGKKTKTPVQVGVDFGRCERRDIVHTKPFEWIVAGFAHAHVLLFSIGHKLQEEEKAADLTSMILGFDEFLVRARHSTSETTWRIGYSITSTKTEWLGYLTIPEEILLESI